MVSPRLVAGSALIVLVYLGLGLTNVFTRAPWCDEAWFGNPAYNLAYKGFMGTTVLEPASSTWKSVKLTGIDRHTYWVMPLNLLVNAAGFRVFGFSIYSMRLLSLLWGLIALCAWGAILWKLTGQPLLTLGSLGLIAVDYHFLLQASDGRMDVMTVALGWSGVAAYLLLRERSFPLAVAVSQSLAAMAFFTHPNGAMLALILAVTTLYFDRRRVRFGTVALAAFRTSQSAPDGRCTSRRVRPIFWRSFWATPAAAGPPSQLPSRRCGWRSRTAIWTATGWLRGRREPDG